MEPSSRRRWRFHIVTAMIAFLILGPAAPALAHVDLLDSTPTDGATMAEPVEEITLSFSTEATLANDGVVIYDATATPVDAEVVVISPTEVVVRPFEPLGEGAWAITWSMQAPDAHPTTGGFEFSVAVPAPAPSTDTHVAATEGAGQGENPPIPHQPDPDSETPSILAEVLPSESWLAGWMATMARLLSLGGALIGIGSLVFALMVFEGSSKEARMIGFWIRRAGLAVAVSVPIEILATSLGLGSGSILSGLAPANLATAAGGSLGFALAFRLIGGVAIVAGTRLVVVTGRPLSPSHHGGDLAVLTRERLHVAASPGALVGAGIVAVSFLFDGHTVTAEPTVLVRFASLIHVVGGAVWFAGVCLLARLLLGRQWEGDARDTARLIIPFSTIAGAAVAMIGLAGGVLALSIADGLGTFFTTGWGRALLAKMALAAVAGAIGAYNHLVVVPALRTDPDGPMGEDAIRRTIGIEAGLLIAVVAVTAVFVGLSAV